MNVNDLKKGKEYGYKGDNSIERVIYKYKTINGYLFEGMIGCFRSSAIMTESQVNDLISEICKRN